MALVTVKPTAADLKVANFVTRYANGRIERTAQLLTWGADGKVLFASAALIWLCSRRSGEATRKFGDHLLICSVVTAAFPHLLKRLVDQERPDRRTIRGHWRGIPYSGRKYDAFPSGHAVHVGALVSAATLLQPAWRNMVWAAGGVLVTTRIVLLAHWLTDVLAGLAIGIGAERLLRPLTVGKDRPTDRHALKARDRVARIGKR